MKTVFLIRHAKSSWDDPYLSDEARPLNNRGKKDAPFMAELLRRKYDRIDTIFSSPARRAFSTAKKFAKTFEIPKENIIKDPNLYLAGLGSVINLLMSIESDDVTHIAVFGHNPGWTQIVNSIPKVHIDNVPTTGIAVIECDIDQWKLFNLEQCVLKEFLYPKKYS